MLEEQRLKEERRRAAVEEKRRQRLEEDKVRCCPGDTWEARLFQKQHINCEASHRGAMMHS